MEKSPTSPQDHNVGYKDLTALFAQPHTSIAEQKLPQEKTQSYQHEMSTFSIFYIVLPNTVLAYDAKDVAQSLLHILEFKLDGELGEDQVVYLREGDDDVEVSKHNGQNEEGIE